MPPRSVDSVTNEESEMFRTFCSEHCYQTDRYLIPEHQQQFRAHVNKKESHRAKLQEVHQMTNRQYIDSLLFKSENVYYFMFINFQDNYDDFDLLTSFIDTNQSSETGFNCEKKLCDNSENEDQYLFSDSCSSVVESEHFGSEFEFGTDLSEKVDIHVHFMYSFNLRTTSVHPFHLLIYRRLTTIIHRSRIIQTY